MATKYRVEITKTAESDIEEIWIRIGADSLENATRFVADLEEKIGTLEKMPRRCPSMTLYSEGGRLKRKIVRQDSCC